MGAIRPRSSVVIAAWQAEDALPATLAALKPQLDSEVEVLVSADIRTSEDLRTSHPWVAWLPPSPGALVPELWAAGIAAAGGRTVITTTAHFVPEPDWLERIAEVFEHHDISAVGGAILPPEGGSHTDWATYFLRYGSYSELRDEGDSEDLAADNAAYRQADLAAHRAVWEEGFWEPDLHRRILAAGGRLRFAPEVRVRHRRSVPALLFCGLRRRHGRQFGSSRMRDKPLAVRLAAALASPLIPAVLLAKVARRAIAQRRNVGRFLAALPWLTLFIACWAFGEATGYWQALPGWRTRTAR